MTKNNYCRPNFSADCNKLIITWIRDLEGLSDMFNCSYFYFWTESILINWLGICAIYIHTFYCNRPPIPFIIYPPPNLSLFFYLCRTFPSRIVVPVALFSNQLTRVLEKKKSVSFYISVRSVYIDPVTGKFGMVSSFRSRSDKCIIFWFHLACAKAEWSCTNIEHYFHFSEGTQYAWAVTEINFYTWSKSAPSPTLVKYICA